MNWTLEMVGAGAAALLAMGSGALAIGLNWRLRRRLAEAENALGERQASVDAAVESLRLALQEVCRDLDSLQTPVNPTPAPASGTLNLSKRSQALRLHRRGDGPDQIAASLGIPLQEVTLLLKVHEIVMANV